MNSVEKLSDLISEAEDVLHMALVGAEVGIWCWRPDEDTLFWNHEMYELFGVTRDSFQCNVGAFFDCLAEQEKERVKQALDRSIATGEMYDVVYQLESVPNRFIRGRGKYYPAGDGRSAKFVGVCILRG